MMDAGMFQVLKACCTCIMSTNQGTPMLPPMTAASMKIIVLSKYKLCEHTEDTVLQKLP